MQNAGPNFVTNGGCIKPMKLHGGSISRILFPDLRRFDDHSSERAVARAPLAANPDFRAKVALRRTARNPYSALLLVGLALPVRLPVLRCAFTAPFHPYRRNSRRSVLCGAIPGVTPAGRYPAPLPCGVRTFLGSDDPRPSDLPCRASVSLLGSMASTPCEKMQGR